ncbi:MarP family serine protease [Patescibacteria group bacterium]|nr:MarP family serine protease [Patescibacteria group bacterium]
MFNLIDGVIILLLLLAIGRGWRAGLIRQGFGLLGFWGGVALGIFLALQVVNRFPAQSDRALAVIMAVLLGLIIGSTLGDILGVLTEKLIRLIRAGWLDSLLGSVLAVAMTLLTVWLLSGLASYVPVPEFSQEVRASSILRYLNDRLPPTPTVLADLEQRILPTFYPRVFMGLAPTPAPPVGPVPTALVRQAMDRDQASVVKVTGLACAAVSEGSGFIASPGLVVTNAHVVAGVSRPIVYDGNGAHEAVVVLYDPTVDLAALRVSGLTGAPLTLDTVDQPRGTEAAALGYPENGGFTGMPAGVLQELLAEGQNIYNTGNSVRKVYELQSPIEPGNSGGPLVLPDGRVIGIIFAKSVSDVGIGYALTAGQVQSEISQAAGLTRPVSTQGCVAE